MKKRASKRQKSKKTPNRDPLQKLIEDFMTGIHNELAERWRVWPVVVDAYQQTEVLVGLVRHQVSLATHIASAPQCWTFEFAPIVLRCMIDTFISIAWILEKPAERALQFIEDGLGKEKLMIMHRTDELKLLGKNPSEDEVIQSSMEWVESQKYSFAIDVNLSGSWSGVDTRTMAEEAGHRDFYRFTYPSFSAAVHGTWNHISRFDLVPCENPLHAGHRIPRFDQLGGSTWAIFMVAKYLDKTFRLVDAKLGMKVGIPSTFGTLFEDQETDDKK
jgi:hypothetical protein